jgi:hypothetical protein
MMCPYFDLSGEKLITIDRREKLSARIFPAVGFVRRCEAGNGGLPNFPLGARREMTAASEFCYLGRTIFRLPATAHA